jgi:hypothetical protein
MRVVNVLAFVGLALVSPVSAVAQSSQTIAPSDQNYASPLFSKLFAPPSTPLLPPSVPAVSPPRVKASRPAVSGARPTIRCGMTMVPVDRSFDAKIRRPVPAGKAFTIKRVKPPICGQ